MTPRARRDACGSEEPPTPEPVYNAPSRADVDYRVGRFATFRESMLRAIAEQPALEEWSTRASEDRGIALIEMWAYLGDILTFYQERIANEAFLRTAEHRDSLDRLSRLLGYEPAPGLAAETTLVFEVEEGETVLVPERLRVQSVPPPGGRPQRFEAVESVRALPELNQSPAFPEPRGTAHLDGRAESAALDPAESTRVSDALGEGDALVIFADGSGGSAGPAVETRRVAGIHRTREGLTALQWDPSPSPDVRGGRVFPFRRQMRLFGHDAPTSYVATEQRPASDGASHPVHEPRFVSLSDAEVALTPSERVRGGEDAPGCLPLDREQEGVSSGDRVLLDAREAGSDERHVALLRVVGVDSGRMRIPPEEPARQGSDETIRSPALQATVTRLLVEPERPGSGGGADAALVASLNPRESSLYLLDEPEVTLWRSRDGAGLEVPGEFDDSSPADNAICLPVQGIAARVSPGRRLVLVGGAEEPVEVRVESAEEGKQGDYRYTRIDVEHPEEVPWGALDVGSLRLLGNAARATHGETVADEVLGDGDASERFQTFTVSEPPVTHVADPTSPTGGRSTVTVRVDGVEWTAADSLYGRAGSERVYEAKPTEDGGTELRFGDGEMGRRLPTGRENVRATYRTGLGEEGNVDAASLTTLLDRPEGLEAGTNPAAAEQGTDPEDGDEIRRNAPGSVRTFGRIVSLRDFEDAARRVIGIAKARTNWKWAGGSRVVRLVAVGEDGARVDGGDRADRLRSTLDDQRPTHQALRIVPHRTVCVSLRAQIQADPDRIAEDVLERAETALRRRFAFDRLQLGQVVHASDLYRHLQGVEGVTAAHVLEWRLVRPSEDGCGPEGAGTEITPADVGDRDLLELAPDGLRLELAELASAGGRSPR